MRTAVFPELLAGSWQPVISRTASTVMPATSAPHSTPDQTAALVAAAQSGDSEAFAALVRAYADRVARLVSRFARSRADLEEISQDVFIEVHRCLSRYDGRAPFSHWLGRIATRRCYDHLRRLYRRRWLTSLDALLSSGFQPSASAPPAYDDDDPRLAALHEALRRLSPAQQTVLTLLELEQLTVREVAALTGWSESNVKVRAHRARAALKHALAPGGAQH